MTRSSKRFEKVGAPSVEGISRVGQSQLPQGAIAFDEPGIDIRAVIGIVRRRLWLIIAVVFLLTTLATLIGLQQTPHYTAKALVMIEPGENRMVDLGAVVEGLATDNSTVETQIRVLRSHDLIERVMLKQNLFSDAEFNAKKRQDHTALQLDYAGPGDRLLAHLPTQWLIASGLAREPLPLALTANYEEHFNISSVTVFENRLKVMQEGRSFVIGVQFTSVDPAKAARIANSVAELYVKDQLDAKLASTTEAAGWLGERLKGLREDVRLSEQAVEDYRIASGLVDARGVSLDEQELVELNREVSATRAELAEKRTRLQLIRGMRDRGESLDSVAEVLSSIVIVNLRNQEAQLLRQESELRTYFGERHPRIQNLVAEKANLQAKIGTEVDRIIKNSEHELAVLSGRLASLEASVAEFTGRTERDRQLYVRLRELQREADASRRLYENFLQRFKETREQQEIVGADSRIISRAAAPERPSTPGANLYAAVGFTASLMVGGLLALLLERLDNGIRSGRQVEEILGLHTLGLVPRLKGRSIEPHQYLLAKPLSAYTESIRAIDVSLKLSNVDEPPAVVLVTSSLPQEGKSTLALSLATFAAQSSQRVILMDLDLRHPSVHRALGMKPEVGFVEYMGGERLLDDIIRHDENTGIDYLPVKRQTVNPTDMLASRKMLELIEELRRRYDFIVMDSAPLLGVTDSKITARLADAVLFIVQWEICTAETARNAVAHLMEADAIVAGAVLTQVNAKKHAYYGYGDSAHYYGKYRKYYVE